MKNSILIIDVTPRDGLQNLDLIVPTEEKILLVEMLIDAGVVNEEVTSFVSPKRMPQMADAEEVCSAFTNRDGFVNGCLIPNAKGIERAIAAGAKEIAFVLSASDVHSMANLGRSFEDSLNEAHEIASIGLSAKIKIRASIGCAFGYEPDPTPVAVQKIVSAAKRLIDYGFTTLTLADTTGIANPQQVLDLCSAVKEAIGNIPLGIHLHQAGGIEFANSLAAYNAGVTVFETACGGLGGCPFAMDSEGNTDTAILVRMFEQMGIDTGIDQKKIYNCAKYSKKMQASYSTSKRSK